MRSMRATLLWLLLGTLAVVMAAAGLRASEMACEAIFKGTKVDGVYDKDPVKFPDAKRYETVSYDEVLQKHLGVMDASAIALARDNDLPIIVFSLDEPGGFCGILAGEGLYTRVTDGKTRPGREVKA